MRGFETRRPDFLSFSDALDRVLAGVPPLPPRTVSLEEAPGLAVSQPIVSPLTLPPGPTSHMDGYAVRTDEIERLAGSLRSAEFRVIGASLPGSPWTTPLPARSAIRVMTGALLPMGSDRVFPVEDTDGESGEPGLVRIRRSEDGRSPWSVPGKHVREAGEEVREGDLLASAGDSLDFGLLALLGTTGAASVPVHPQPRVAVLVTGSELVPVGSRESLGGGLRRADVLSPVLPILVRSAGGLALPPATVPDEAHALRGSLEKAATEADFVVTTGGASMGTADLVKEVLDGMGFELDFWRIRMRPGSPVSFGHLPVPAGPRRVPVLSLPGNPVSAVVGCLVLGIPAIRALGGHRRRFLPTIRATLRDPLPGPEHLTRFFRVALDPEGGGRWGARPSAHQGSGALRSVALADGLALIPEGKAAPDVGEPVEVLLAPRSGWEENR